MPCVLINNYGLILEEVKNYLKTEFPQTVIEINVREQSTPAEGSPFEKYTDIRCAHRHAPMIYGQ